jgi:hypothetical protein
MFILKEDKDFYEMIRRSLKENMIRRSCIFWQSFQQG